MNLCQDRTALIFFRFGFSPNVRVNQAVEFRFNQPFDDPWLKCVQFPRLIAEPLDVFGGACIGQFRWIGRRIVVLDLADIQRDATDFDRRNISK